MIQQDQWHGSAVYKIEVRGRLGPEWAAWFDGKIIETQGSTTIIHVNVSDQAALHGILTRINDLGLPLLSVIRIKN